ncbi:MAG: arabinose 5-phosphate isomerase [marine bacterium B5-7]|nr:MAG: arabinose 5-phosphate isomerase [marine bacterium B5-7]
MDTKQLIKAGQAVIDAEANAVADLKSRIDDQFAKACQHCLDCKGRVILTGMGKSGHIAQKLAATFASTGTPAFFLHPAEAGHGDLGMVTTRDVVIAISNSGNTKEIVNILFLIEDFGVPLITLTGDADSVLAKRATVNLDVSVNREACPLNLAPTSSTTAALAMGDALALSLLEARGFNEADFARAHPDGSLGRRLLTRVKDLMHTGKQLPIVQGDATVMQALIEMSDKKLGFTTIVNEKGALQGVFTDGDIRRCLEENMDFHQTKIIDAKKGQGLTFDANALAADALHVMNERQITSLVIVDADRKPQGAIHMHDILKAGIS